MVEVGKFGDKTIVIDGRYISIFKAGKLLKKYKYMTYRLPDGYDYLYRRPITITEKSGADLTDYQVKIVISGDDPIWNHARCDGADIRFCYHEEEQMLPYWIEKYDPLNKEAIIWVKVPSIPANSTINIFMYYGNEDVTSESDGEATFIFFDDFETDLSKWDVVTDGGTIELSTLYAKQGKQSCRIYHAGTTATFDCYIKHDLGESLDNVRVDVYLFHRSPQGVLWIGESGYDPMGIGDDGNHSNWRYRLGGTWYDSGIARDFCKWHEFSIAKIGRTAKYWIDGSELEPKSNNPGFREIMLGGFWENNVETHLFVDIVRVRKYVEPEPTISVGAEE